MILDGAPLTDADRLRLHREMEAEDAMCPVHFPERLLEHRRFALVMRMTALRFAELDAHERRNYRRWAEHFADVFAEKARLFTRNSSPEPQTPAYLLAEG